MKKHLKVTLLCLFILSFVMVVASLIWIYVGNSSPIWITLAKGFFALFVVCFFLLQFYIESKDTHADYKESAAMKERAHRELCYAAVTINQYYHLMVEEKESEDKARLEASYNKARQAFQYKAEMYDAIFQTRTVLIEGKDDDGNIIEITFDSRSA